VRSYFKTSDLHRLSAPFHPLPPSYFDSVKSRDLPAGLFSVALVVSLSFKSNARSLSGSLPFGVRTFLFWFLFEKRLPDLFRLPGKSILAKSVQQIQLKFLKFLKLRKLQSLEFYSQNSVTSSTSAII